MQKIMLIAFSLLFPLQSFALEVGDFAPCVVLEGRDAQGGAVEECIRDKQNTNQSFTLVDFFSIHCSTCLENLPKLSRLATEIEETTTTRLVSVDRRREAVESFLDHSKYSPLIQFPVAFDVQRDAKKAYGVISTPTLFLLDSQCSIVYKHGGELTDADLEEIKELVGLGQERRASLNVGDVAPCVVLTGLDSNGNDTEGCIRDQEASEQEYTILDFFSIDCSACEKSLPVLSRIAKAAKGKATTRLVSIDSNETEVRDYLNRKKGFIHFPVAFDLEQEAASAYGVQQIPTVFILNKKNEVVFKHVGTLDLGDALQIENLISQL